MGYIKKLKNNELVGGTDKTTIYPVTSTEAVFEEVSDNEFKSQKYLNNHITNERIVDNTIENRKLKDDTIDMGKLNTQLRTVIQNAYDASWKVKEEPFSLETKYDANDVVYDPATNSSYVSLTADNQGNPVNPEDEGYVEGKWRIIINGISAVESTEVINAKVEELETEVDNKIDDAQDQLDDMIADAATELARATKAADDAAAEASAVVANKVADAQIGYFECNTATGTALKQTTFDYIGTGNDKSYYTIPAAGSNVRIKMQYANTSTGTVELQFGSNTATRKPLIYNGEPASQSNTWDDGEVLSIYYDPTYNNNTGAYQASNSQGGGGSKGMKELKGITGAFIITSGDTLGQVVSTGPEAPLYQYIKYPVNEGDVVMVSGKGAAAGRLWGIVGDNDVMIDKSASNLNGNNLVIIMPEGARFIALNSTIASNPKWYYAKKDSEGAQEMFVLAYLYDGWKTLAVGQAYKEDESVKTSDKQLCKITKDISLMNLNDTIQAGDFKVYGGHTYKAIKDVPAYSGEDSDYSSGDYAIINSRVNSFDGSLWEALTDISTYASNTEYWESLTAEELVSEVTDKTYNIEYEEETLYYKDATTLSSPNTSAGAPTILSGFRVIAGHTYRIYIKSKSSIPGTLKLGLGSNGNISIAAASILNGYTWNKTAATSADSRIYLDGATVTGIEIYTKIQDITEPSTISITKKTSIKEKIQELDSRIDSSTDSISGLADSVSEITKTYDALVERDITKFVGSIIAGGAYSPVSNYLTVSPDSESNQNGIATIVSPQGATRFGWYIGALPINMDIIISMDIVSSRTGGQSAFDKNVDGGTINTTQSGGSIITRWYDSDSTSNVYNLTTTVTNYKFVIRRTNSIKFMMCPTSSLAAGQTITISNFNATIRCSQYDYERFFTRPEQKMMLRAATSSNGQVKDANAVSLLHFSDIHGDGTAAFAIRSFYDDNASDIDDILNTGDTVQAKFADDFDFYLKAHLTDALYCLGNHDSATANSGYWTGTDRNQVYARYIGSYAESWGITQPENAVTDSLMYWYKDYTTQKIRLICLDTVWSNADANYKTAELAWFRSVLSDAAENEYKVVVCSHYLPGYCDEEDIVKNQLDSPNNMHDYDFTLASSSFSSYDQPSMLLDYITAVENFIHNENGTFIVWLCGHLHNSLFWRVKGHHDVLAMTIDCAGNIAGSWHKYHRFKRGLEDCFCAHQIIINGQYIKCIQLGFQVDKLLRSSKSLTYDYINKKVISEN